MNDKCAAGTGRFLDMMARTMELTLDEMGELGLKWKNDVVISNMCTVFAESEVVSLVAQDTPPADIIHGLNNSVAGKTGSAEFETGKETHAWFTGFAPAEDPKLVVTVLVEEAGSGGHVAAPIAKSIFDTYFSR